ncbi:hypothetical protein BANRA_02500 [Acinetobacter baumannii]|nr:hypothetical protein BANRA_02500 [Acinetobacter baumannii]
MTSKLVHVKDADKGSDIYFDPQGLEGAVLIGMDRKITANTFITLCCICEAVV